MNTYYETARYRYQPETLAQAAKLTPRTVAEHSHKLGAENCEPLLVCLDSLLRYAKAHELRFESKLFEDGFLGEPWLVAVTHVRKLLNGNGAIALERGITTDSKDNGVCEGTFWAALDAAGFTEADMERAA